MSDDPKHESPNEPSTVRWHTFRAVLFDLDGVLTPTADVHRMAWKETFDAFLRYVGGGHASRPFTDADYFEFVDGRPRYDGVRAFLSSRGLFVPDGDPTDHPGFESVGAVGNLKNESFRTVLSRDGVQPYAGSVTLLDHLQALKIGVAVVSSSANARIVLEAARLADRFAVVVDGLTAATEHLAGKPSPEMFLHAAALLRTSPDQSVVVEDAISGVEAGRAGSFGLVVGVDRENQAERLRRAGAHIVVSDLSETM